MNYCGMCGFVWQRSSGCLQAVSPHLMQCHASMNFCVFNPLNLSVSSIFVLFISYRLPAKQHSRMWMKEMTHFVAIRARTHSTNKFMKFFGELGANCRHSYERQPEYNGSARFLQIYLAHELRTKQQSILLVFMRVCRSISDTWTHLTLVLSTYKTNHIISYSSSHACTHRIQSMHEFPVGRKKNRIEFSCFIASAFTRTVSHRKNKGAANAVRLTSAHTHTCGRHPLSLSLSGESIRPMAMATGQDKLHFVYFFRSFVLWFDSQTVLCRLNGFSPLDIKLSLLVCFAEEMFSRKIRVRHRCVPTLRHSARSLPSFRFAFFPFSSQTTPRWFFFFLLLIFFCFCFCDEETNEKVYDFS